MAPREGTGIHEEQDLREEVDEPQMYHVVMLNDDYTTRFFVIWVLMKLFGKTYEAAEQIMYDVHYKGRGLAGTYTYDIARTKARHTEQLARDNGYPFKVVTEPAA